MGFGDHAIMIVAIYKNTGTGPIHVEEFREAASVAAAVLAFRTEYNPDAPEDYSGIDTGWQAWQSPGEGNLWAADRDANPVTLAPSAVAVALRIGWYVRGGRTIYEPPTHTDYLRALDARLEQVITNEVDGEVRAIEYRAPDPDDTNNPPAQHAIVREDYTYTRDAAGFAISRDLVITWIRTDDSDHPTTKTRSKTYSQRDSIREGKRRRSNVVDNLEMIVAGYLLATETTLPDTDPGYPAQAQAALELGREFLKTHRGEVADFVESSLQEILTAVANYDAESIQNAPAAWMDNPIGGGLTIRDVIADTMNIWD